MFEWAISLVPWWGWLALAGAAVVAVQMAFGWKAAIGAAVPLLAALGLGWARNLGVEQERAKQSKRQVDAVKTRKETDDEIDQIGHADVDERLARWNRDE